jgi:hypothetical protein
VLRYDAVSELANVLGPPGDVDRGIGYAADIDTVAELVERAVIDDGHDVVVVPISGADGDPAALRLGNGNRPALRHRLRPLLEAHPEARVVVAQPATGETPSLADLLGALGTGSADESRLLSQAIERAFDGDTDRFGRFIAALQAGLPPGTQLALRGSAVAGSSYKTDEPFDSRGPQTSDLDVVLLGEEAMAAWDGSACFLPGVNTWPLSDGSSWVAPTLEPARAAAQAIAGRPVSLQAMARWFLDLRSGLQGQPYVLIDA